MGAIEDQGLNEQPSLEAMNENLDFDFFGSNK